MQNLLSFLAAYQLRFYTSSILFMYLFTYLILHSDCLPDLDILYVLLFCFFCCSLLISVRFKTLPHNFLFNKRI
jgi:hypothetical protein